MPWIAYSPLFAIPVFLLIVAIFKLRVDRAIVGQFNVSVILFAISMVIQAAFAFAQSRDALMTQLFLSGLLNAGGWLLFAQACLKLAWANRMPLDDDASRIDKPQRTQD